MTTPWTCRTIWSMPLAPNWLSVLWFALVPLTSASAALLRYLHIHHAPRALIPGAARTQIGLALVASQFVTLSLICSARFETALWPALLSASAIAAIALANRAAALKLSNIMPGVHQVLPRDGLDAIEQSTRPLSVRRRTALLRLALPILPGIASYYTALGLFHRNWSGLWMLGVLLLGPLLVQPYRRFWHAPLVFAPFIVLLGAHAVQLRNTLPAGRWSTVVSGSDCTTQVRFSADRARAWCVDGVRE